MSYKIDRNTYAQTYGPTTGDRVRLADTELFIEVEKDLTTYGDEVKFGGGKVIRDGMGQSQVRRSDVFVDPFEFLILSNLSKHLSVSIFDTSSCGVPGLIISEALLAAALPKTTRSINEFDPSRFAPWTETHAASPIAINPGTVFSEPLTVNTSAL